MTKKYEVLCDSHDREKWLTARQTGIGASDSPGVLSVPGAYGSPLSVALSKSLPLGDEKEESEWQAAGRRIEPFIGEWFVEDAKIKAQPFGLLLRSLEYPWMLATPDWMAYPEEYGDSSNNYPLQIKNTMKSSEWDDGVPPAVYCQVQHEMVVTGAPWAYVAVLLTGNRFRWDKVPDNPEYQQLIIDGTRDLWEKIEHSEPIDTDGHPATTRALAQMYPEDTGVSIPMDGDALAIMTDLDKINVNLREDGNMKTILSNAIRALMGDAAVGIFTDGTEVSYKAQTRKPKNCPDCGTEVVKGSTFRVLRRKGTK